MLLKFCGLIDLAMALMIVLVGLQVPVGTAYLAIVVLHAVKALIFIKDFLSLLDLAIAAYTLILPFYSNPLVSLVAVIFLFFKGVYSMV